jgi:hypothetical protein
MYVLFINSCVCESEHEEERAKFVNKIRGGKTRGAGCLHCLLSWHCGRTPFDSGLGHVEVELGLVFFFFFLFCVGMAWFRGT